ncbi:MAG: polyphosphate kinase 1 [Nitrospirota bacterium]
MPTRPRNSTRQRTVSVPASRPPAKDGRRRVPAVSAPDPPMTQQTAADDGKPAGLLPSPAEIRSPELYLNRELTWLDFTRRVLHEAIDERTPLLERIKFVAIVSANLDEFFMKRIGGLKQQVGAGVHDLTVDGRTPHQQLAECHREVREIEAEKEALLRVLIDKLHEHDIHILTYDALEEEERQQVREHYVTNIFPLVTPQAVDPAHPFPFISNLSLNLFITLRYPGDVDTSLARVKVPVGANIPRFLPVGHGHRLVPLEEVMSHNLDLLFPKMTIEQCELFHVTRNANTERNEEDADDLLAMIESEVRQRRFAPIVRMVVAENMDPTHRGMVAAELLLTDDADVFETDGMMGMRDLFEIAALDIPELHDPPHHPTDHHRLVHEQNIFHGIRRVKSILLQHPYESFSTSVERFLWEASQDPKVRAIKMTLYRTSRRSKVIDYLIEAAQNGKQVAVVVELKARFDETANIRWANQLEEAGIHVTYGVVGLKTHCKVILVVRQDYNGLRRYAHIGTGNYHAETARLYCDLGILTSDDLIGRDLTELFNYLTTGYTPTRDYKKILPSPKVLKSTLLAKIQREIEHHADGGHGLIQFKLNALEDVDITQALYQAAKAGVRVDLVVRDTCRLRPGIPGISENVRVVSIVGRFLEHSRVYFFANGGKPEYFIGSADAMKRNLEHRVEVVVPVEDPRLQADLRAILDAQLTDQRSAWEMQSDGSYVQRQPPRPDAPGSQQVLIRLAERRTRYATRLRKRRLQGPSSRRTRR